MASVVCHYDHTVSITISNVDDIRTWTEEEWRLENNANCDPTFNVPAETVNYDKLVLPDCANYDKQLNYSIKYQLKISATKDDPKPPAETSQLRSYDHMYYIWCEYDNQNRSYASFVPIVNRADNDSSMYM